MRFLGIEVARKTDILALAAFMLSVAGILYQVVGFLRGPDVLLFPPEQVLITTKKMGSDEYVIFAAPMAYVNKGQPGYNAAIRSEWIRFTMGGKTYQQKWQDFITSGSSDNKLEVTKTSDAHPVAVSAGSTESHETRYSPRTVRINGTKETDPNKNYLKWNDFVKNLAVTKELKLEFGAEVYGESPVIVSCTIYPSPGFITYLRENKWHAPTCWAE